uniref:Ubiquitin-like protease family profile domain-containing protein n=1 Tax=Lactuca sativa TaxID=4236 RepID=A0A9R1WUZ1_LACSA|nr:hypothetical protein LSAT_V11C900477370 [Lactuca sativa]
MAPIRIWIYDMLPAVRACGFVLRKNRDMPRMKRWSGTKKIDMGSCEQDFFKDTWTTTKTKYSMYMVNGNQFHPQYGTILGDKTNLRLVCRPVVALMVEWKHNLDGVLKRLHTLKQHVYMNREPREVFVEVNNEEFWNEISFEEPAVVQDEVMNKNNTTENIFGDIEHDKELEERNNNAGNKFDDDVFDVNDYNEAKEVSDEDEVIITGNVDYYDDYGVDGKELHTTPKQKRRAKKKVDIKSTSPVPPPAFAVAHDFSVLRLQPYVAGGEVVIHNYLFHSYDVQHRLFNFVLDRDFWSALFGHTHDGWLESSDITIWYRLLIERRFERDRHTIMPPNFFVCRVLEEGQDWRAFMDGIAMYPNFMVAWWVVDTVLLPIHSSPNHWLFGELRLASMEVHIYDSLGRVAYEKFKYDGTLTKFESRVANYLDTINYWARRNIPRIPLNIQFIYEENVPNKVVIWEIAVLLFVCLWSN